MKNFHATEILIILKNQSYNAFCKHIKAFFIIIENKFNEKKLKVKEILVKKIISEMLRIVVTLTFFNKRQRNKIKTQKN